MTQKILNRPNLTLVTGFIAGLALSAVATLATLSAWGYFEEGKVQLLEQQLHAIATHGADSIALATGEIDEGVEGVFILDFITGDLTCQVLNARTGALGGLFKQNVVQDLGVEQGKQPKYLLVTGSLQVRQNISNIKPAKSIVYVADSNTGRYVAYMLPWNQQLANVGGGQGGPMVVIGRDSARNAIVE